MPVGDGPIRRVESMYAIAAGRSGAQRPHLRERDDRIHRIEIAVSDER